MKSFMKLKMKKGPAPSISKGFTLIEILVTISIIGILMSVLLVAFQGGKKAGRDGKRKADIEQIRTALEIYRADCKQYPDNPTFRALITSGGALVGDGTNCPATNTYIAAVPIDPLGPTAYKYYYNRSATNTYILCASLETGSAVHDADCGAATTVCGTVPNLCNYKQKNP